MTRLRGVLLLALAFVATACSLPPKHEYEIAPGHAYSSSFETVLLLPINEMATLPKGLEKGDEAVFRLIRDYLQAQGLEVQTPEISKFRSTMRAAQNTARIDSMSSADKVLAEVALADLIPQIAEDLAPNADLIVMPNMAIRVGARKGMSLRWDGVRRVEPVTERVEWSEESTSSAASLHVAIFEADGTYVFSGYGGLDVLWLINVRSSSAELIEARLEDEAHLREGVCVAFYPYFGAGQSC